MFVVRTGHFDWYLEHSARDANLELNESTKRKFIRQLDDEDFKLLPRDNQIEEGPTAKKLKASPSDMTGNSKPNDSQALFAAGLTPREIREIENALRFFDGDDQASVQGDDQEDANDCKVEKTSDGSNEEEVAGKKTVDGFDDDDNDSYYCFDDDGALIPLPEMGQMMGKNNSNNKNKKKMSNRKMWIATTTSKHSTTSTTSLAAQFKREPTQLYDMSSAKTTMTAEELERRRRPQKPRPQQLRLLQKLAESSSPSSSASPSPSGSDPVSLPASLTSTTVPGVALRPPFQIKGLLANDLIEQCHRDHFGIFHCCSPDNCSYITKMRQNMLRHLYIHTGEKPHGCSTCGRRFAQQSNLKRHQQKNH